MRRPSRLAAKPRSLAGIVEQRLEDVRRRAVEAETERLEGLGAVERCAAPRRRPGPSRASRGEVELREVVVPCRPVGLHLRDQARGARRPARRWGPGASGTAIRGDSWPAARRRSYTWRVVSRSAATPVASLTRSRNPGGSGSAPSPRPAPARRAPRTRSRRARRTPGRRRRRRPGALAQDPGGEGVNVPTQALERSRPGRAAPRPSSGSANSRLEPRGEVGGRARLYEATRIRPRGTPSSSTSRQTASTRRVVFPAPAPAATAVARAAAAVPRGALLLASAGSPPQVLAAAPVGAGVRGPAGRGRRGCAPRPAGGGDRLSGDLVPARAAHQGAPGRGRPGDVVADGSGDPGGTGCPCRGRRPARPRARASGGPSARRGAAGGGSRRRSRR